MPPMKEYLLYNDLLGPSVAKYDLRLCGFWNRIDHTNMLESVMSAGTLECARFAEIMWCTRKTEPVGTTESKV